MNRLKDIEQRAAAATEPSIMDESSLQVKTTSWLLDNAPTEVSRNVGMSLGRLRDERNAALADIPWLVKMVREAASMIKDHADKGCLECFVWLKKLEGETEPPN